MITLNPIEDLVLISINNQWLQLIKNRQCIFSCHINSAKNGVGQLMGSEKTPLGWHQVSDVIGNGDPINTVFASRQPTGEIFNQELFKNNPDRDWILTRIIRLIGLEMGHNLGGDVDTYNRYIYLHGTPDNASFEQPSSHGCIRLRNLDIISLCQQINTQTKVWIYE
ncbi:MAG TPA: L,D-transpeptidase [Gammaproteobacteria bacterium]|nr:L,D-transpeptidase [Gammaproteobacteria bacterium]